MGDQIDSQGGAEIAVSLERDIYKIYLDGPYDWLNPVDMFTEFLTDTSSGSWSSKSHEDKIYEITRQYPNLDFQDIDAIVKNQQKLRGLS